MKELQYQILKRDINIIVDIQSSSNKYKMSAITITFGQAAQNHRGMQVIGQKTQHGFSIPDICKAKEMFQDKGYKTQLVDLNTYLDEPSQDATVLVVRKGVNCLLEESQHKSQSLFKELVHLKWDTKAKMYGRVVNKKARYNLCFGDVQQKSNYEEGKGTIIEWKEVPLISLIRRKLPQFIPKSQNMMAQGNYYYDSKKCGVCFHGDQQRKKVIGIRLSTTEESSPLHYQWFKNKQPIGKRAIVHLDNGDLYIMSEKAVGNDEKKRNIPTLKHATGCAKFTNLQ